MEDFIAEWIYNRDLNDFDSTVIDKSYSTLLACIKDLNQEQVKAELCKLSYKEFLGTDYWKAIKSHKKCNANYCCQECGAEEHLQVHHITYANHGAEHSHLNDLVVLCDECHKKYHSIRGKLKKAKQAN